MEFTVKFNEFERDLMYHWGIPMDKLDDTHFMLSTIRTRIAHCRQEGFRELQVLGHYENFSPLTFALMQHVEIALNNIIATGIIQLVTLKDDRYALADEPMIMEK